MGWIARQARPDVAFYTSKIAQAMGMPRVKDVLLYSKAVQLLKESRDEKLYFVAGIDYGSAEIIGFCDTAFANVDDAKLGADVRSQCGNCVVLAAPGPVEGSVASHVLMWESSSAK